MKRTLPFCALLLIAGCAEGDPYRRPGTWQPEGANAANMAAMLQRPADLVRGRGDARAEPREAADAVTRLWDDHQRAWPSQPNSSASTNATGKQGS